MKIVVSRYNDDIAWIDEFRENVFLYNKGPDFVEGALVLPNVGREGHTIFHYICENYDILDDYTVFLQGNPFDHSPDICEQLRGLLRDGSGNADFSYFTPFRHTYNLLNGCKYHWGLQYQGYMKPCLIALQLTD